MILCCSHISHDTSSCRFALLSFLGCCLIPFCIDSCKDAVHTCPCCGQVVGRYQRLNMWNTKLSLLFGVFIWHHPWIVFMSSTNIRLSRPFFVPCPLAYDRMTRISRLCTQMCLMDFRLLHDFVWWISNVFTAFLRSSMSFFVIGDI